MRTADFNYELPEELIAQEPVPRRDESRLLVLDRTTGRTEHGRFRWLLKYLQPGDCLVLNNSKVIPARIRGRNARGSGRFELLLVEEVEVNDWWVMVRPGRRAALGTQICLTDLQGCETPVTAKVVGINLEGHRRVQFSGTPNILESVGLIGEVPLPPYIRRAGLESRTSDLERYQTVFAEPAGSVAAPTAGLHFTTDFLEEIKQSGVAVCFVTLHVSLGTFAPVKTERVAEHVLHEERYEVGVDCAKVISETRERGGRVFAVGTTAVRVLESVANAHQGRVIAGSGRTRIFIYPPRRFAVVDRLLTNFHLPRSTLLMLVSAFAAPGETGGREMVLRAYGEAVRERYRFFSYGDAMLIL